MSEFEERARRLVAERMAFYGYTPAQIEDASHYVDHYEAGCSLSGEPGGWICTDEDGMSSHPVHDQYDLVAEFIVWVLEAEASRTKAEIADQIRSLCDDYNEDGCTAVSIEALHEFADRIEAPPLGGDGS